MQAGLGVAAKFAHNQRFLIVDAPLSHVCGLRALLVPAYIFVRANYIQSLAQRIVHDLGVSFRAHQQRRGNQSRGVKLTRAAGQGFNELRPRLGVGRLVGHRPQDDRGVIARGTDLFVQLLLGLGQHFGIVELQRPIDGILRPHQQSHPIGRAQHGFVVGIVRQPDKIAAKLFGPSQQRLCVLVRVSPAGTIGRLGMDGDAA